MQSILHSAVYSEALQVSIPVKHRHSILESLRWIKIWKQSVEMVLIVKMRHLGGGKNKFVMRQFWQTIFIFQCYLFLWLKKSRNELLLIPPKGLTSAGENWTPTAFKNKNVAWKFSISRDSGKTACRCWNPSEGQHQVLAGGWGDLWAMLLWVKRSIPREAKIALIVFCCILAACCGVAMWSTLRSFSQAINLLTYCPRMRMLPAIISSHWTVRYYKHLKETIPWQLIRRFAWEILFERSQLSVRLCCLPHGKFYLHDFQLNI